MFLFKHIKLLYRKYREENLRNVITKGLPYLYWVTKNEIILLIPDKIYSVFLHLRLFISRKRDFKLITPVDSYYAVYKPSKQFITYTPSIKNPVSLDESKEYMVSKYIYPSFVEVDNGDIVVDVGAFIGEFSIAVSDKASRVIAIEPDETNAKCLEKNTASLGNVEIIKSVIWKESTLKTFNLSKDPTEHSIFDPDFGTVSNTVTVNTKTLNEIANEKSLDVIDFLKLETEGGEADILEGINLLQIQKIAVDVTEPRDDNLTSRQVRERVESILKSVGYQVKFRNGVVFARI